MLLFGIMVSKKKKNPDGDNLMEIHMKDMQIKLNESEFEVFTDGTDSVILSIEAENIDSRFIDEKVISKETLKTYIDKLQEIYDFTNG